MFVLLVLFFIVLVFMCFGRVDGSVDMIHLPMSYLYYTFSLASEYFRWTCLNEGQQPLTDCKDNVDRILSAFPTLKKTSYANWRKTLEGMTTD